ncbi:sialate O-acetylesterase [Poriferisphaera sp. WC338]|uniref:sialate O-acetylesterase n=1 Tax=Poriferisphaera sp. WC338 TaxID=3425129 RepID=UPI003D81A0AA
MITLRLMSRVPIILAAISFCAFLNISHTAYAEHILVFLLGGQSNMSGHGHSEELPDKLLHQSEIILFHDTSVHSGHPVDRWQILKPAGYVGYDPPRFGPEIGLGSVLHAQLGNQYRIALIKHATGGTNLHADWHPGQSIDDTTNFGPEFSAMIRTTQRAIEILEDQGHAVTLGGMFWVQGEADANANAGQQYEPNLRHFIARIREQFDVPELPFVYARILPYTWRKTAKEVRAAMTNIDQDAEHPAATPGALMVPTKGLETHEDQIHFNTPGMLELGRRLANSLLARSEYIQSLIYDEKD